MQGKDVVLVKCRFAKGGFPTERVFIIDVGNDANYRGVAPANYCFAADRKSPAAEPAQGVTVDGYIIGVKLEPTRVPDEFRVFLADNNIYDINDSLIEEIGSRARVPV